MKLTKNKTKQHAFSLNVIRNKKYFFKLLTNTKKKYIIKAREVLCLYGGENMAKYTVETPEKTGRIDLLKKALLDSKPQIEVDRAVLLTQSYIETENQPMVLRRAKAFEKICENLPIVIRDNELIVGSATKGSRGCQIFPEFSYDWIEAEFDTIAERSADPFCISEEDKNTLREVFKYWNGKTTSELATSYMAPAAITAIVHNIFTPGNYFYSGVGHVPVHSD